MWRDSVKNNYKICYHKKKFDESREKKALVIASLAGFIGTFLQHDIQLLQELGYEVHCAADGRSRTKEENDEYFKQFRTVFHQIDFSSKEPMSKDNMKAFGQVTRLLKEQRYDVIHCHTPIPGVLVRLAAMKDRITKRKKVIYTTHGFYFHGGSSKKEWLIYYTIEKIMSIMSDAIITINYEDYHNAKRMWCKQVYHINSVGLDTSKYANVNIDRELYREKLGISKDELMLLAVGELSDRKNHQVVIYAMEKAKTKNIVFVICGKAISGRGTYDKLVDMVKQKNVRVVFLGHREDIPAICHCADIGVLPSTREGFGMAGVEMLAAGIPVISSNVHGIKDYMIDGINGYMVSPYDVDAFANAIDKLSEKTVRDSMVLACVETAKKFDQSVSFKQMKTIYDEILQ